MLPPARLTDFLQRAGLATQILDLVRRRRPGRIASQSVLPRLEKVFLPAVIKVLDDPLAGQSSVFELQCSRLGTQNQSYRI